MVVGWISTIHGCVVVGWIAAIQYMGCGGVVKFNYKQRVDCNYTRWVVAGDI